MHQLAVFELAFRKMPATRNFIVAAGIGDVSDFLSNFRVTDIELDFLRQQGGFSGEFLTRLKDLRFTGDVYALPASITDVLSVLRHHRHAHGIEPRPLFRREGLRIHGLHARSLPQQQFNRAQAGA